MFVRAAIPGFDFGGVAQIHKSAVGTKRDSVFAG